MAFHASLSHLHAVLLFLKGACGVRQLASRLLHHTNAREQTCIQVVIG